MTDESPPANHMPAPATWASVLRRPTDAILAKHLREKHEHYTVGSLEPQAPYLSPQELAVTGFPGLKGFEEKTIASVDPQSHKATELGLWVREPDDDTKPVYIMFHGRNGHWGYCGDARLPVAKGDNPHYRTRWLEAAAQTGAGVIAVHSRGFGLSNKALTLRKAGKTPVTAEGTDLREAAFWQDMQALADYLLKEKKLAPERVIVAGESLGGAMATMLAQAMTERGAPPKILAVINTFDRMVNAVQYHANLNKEKERLRRHIVWEAPRHVMAEEIAPYITDHQFNTVDRFDALSPKTLIYDAHAPHDQTVQYDNAMRLCDKAYAAKLPCRFRALQGDFLTEGTQYIHTGWNPVAVIKDIDDLYHGRGLEEYQPMRQKGWLADKSQRQKLNGHAHMVNGNGHMNGIGQSPKEVPER